jgi:hypothetical protein
VLVYLFVVCLLFVSAELGQYGTYSAQSVNMCGGFWLAAYSPIFNNMSEAVDSLFQFKDLLGFAKMLSFVTSVVHCVNEAVVITALKHWAVQQLKAGAIAGVAAAGVGTAAATGNAALGDTTGGDGGDGASSAAYQQEMSTAKLDGDRRRTGHGLAEPLV